MTNNGICRVEIETEPDTFTTQASKFEHDTWWKTVKPGKHATFKLSTYEKLFGSIHVDSITYKYFRSYIHLRAAEVAAGTDYKPQRMILKRIIEDGRRFEVRVDEDNQRLTAKRISALD